MVVDDIRMTHSQKSDLTDSSRSSNASSRYGLDEEDESSILVYEYRGDIDIMPQKSLAQRINKDPTKRVTRKPIPRGTASLDLYGHDLCLPEEKDGFKHRAAYWVNLASIHIPRVQYWSRLMTGNYDQLYIISRESSPTGSVDDDESRKISPSSTWEGGSQDVDVAANE